MPGRRELGFEVERFGWTTADRLEVVGRWYGLRGRRFVRPVLTIAVGDDRRRHVALLEHKPWAPAEGEPWIAAFPWTGERTGVGPAELEVGRNLVIDLPPPRLPRRRSQAAVAAGLPPAEAAAVAEPEAPADVAEPSAAESSRAEEVDELEVELWRVRAALAAAREDAEASRAENERERARERDERERLAEGTAATESGLRSDLREQQRLYDELSAERERLDGELTAARAEIDQLRGEFAEAAEETERGLAAGREEAGRVRGELAATQRELGEARDGHGREAQRLREEVALWQARFAEEQQAHQRLQGELATARDDLAAAAAAAEAAPGETDRAAAAAAARDEALAALGSAAQERDRTRDELLRTVRERDEALAARDAAEAELQRARAADAETGVDEQPGNGVSGETTTGRLAPLGLGRRGGGRRARDDEPSHGDPPTREDATEPTRPAAALPVSGRRATASTGDEAETVADEPGAMDADGNGNGNGTPTEPLGARVARAVSETAERAAGQFQRLTAGSAGRAEADAPAEPTTGEYAVTPVTPESPGSRARARSARAAELVARRSTAAEGRPGREPVARRSSHDESAGAIWAVRVAALLLVVVMLVALGILVAALA